MSDRISLHAAISDLSVLPVPDGATAGSLGEDSVLIPERSWLTLRAAAQAVLDGQEIQWCEKHQSRWGYNPDCGWSATGKKCESVLYRMVVVPEETPQ